MKPEEAFWKREALILYPFAGDGEYRYRLLAGGVAQRPGGLVFFRDDWDAPMQPANAVHFLRGSAQERGQGWRFPGGEYLARDALDDEQDKGDRATLEAVHEHIEAQGYDQGTFDRVAEAFTRGAE